MLTFRLCCRLDACQCQLQPSVAGVRGSIPVHPAVARGKPPPPPLDNSYLSVEFSHTIPQCSCFFSPSVYSSLVGKNVTQGDLIKYNPFRSVFVFNVVLMTPLGDFFGK